MRFKENKIILDSPPIYIDPIYFFLLNAHYKAWS